MSATIPQLSNVLENLPPGSEVVFLLGPDRPELVASPFGFVAASPSERPTSSEEIVVDATGRPNVLLAETFESGSEVAAHLLMRSSVAAPDGGEIESRLESFHFSKNGKTWVVSFGVALSDYLQFSENFDTMARSFRLPD